MMNNKITRTLLLFLFICTSISLKAQVNDTLKVIMKMEAVNGLFTYNKYGAVGDLDLLWAVCIDTDDNITTGQGGFDLQLSLSHNVESGSSMLMGNILTATQHAAWKLTSTGATLIDTFHAVMNLQDTVLVFVALKSIPEIAQVKEGNRFFAISLRRNATGFDADTTAIGIIPAIVTDKRTDCASTINNIIATRVINANKNSIVEESQKATHSVRIYPQPLQSYATIDIIGAEPTGSMRLQLTNTHGQIVREISDIRQSSIRIDRNGLPSGVYFYTLKSNEEILSRGKLLMAD
jgi:hypothetical protein